MSSAISVRSVEDLTLVLTAGGGKIDEFGDLIVEARKGFLSKEVEKYIIEYGVIKGTKAVGAFFAARTGGTIEPVLTVKFLQKGGKVKCEWVCHERKYEKLCKQLLHYLRKGFPKARMKEERPRKEEEERPRLFRLSGLYASMLDGMAEVTLATALLKYPLVDSLRIKAGVLQDVHEFLKVISSRLGNGRYIITATGQGWRFIVGLNNDSGEYTPSFISWSSNIRLLGEEALKKLSQLNPEEEVKVLIFAVPSNT